MVLRACLLLVAVAAVHSGLVCAAQPASGTLNPAPHAIDIPPWFKESFLDFREDIREAARVNKRLIAYFGQDGCPYCRELMRANFSQKDIVDKTRRHFDAVALNIWGDRDVVWIDGRIRSEKAFAAHLKVQFTPTLLFFDENGNVVLRLNGYYPPHKFRAALEYVSSKMEHEIDFTDYLQRQARAPSGGRLHDEPFFLKPPFNLERSRQPGAKPLAVLFERTHCAECDEMHSRGFKDKDMLALVKMFDLAQLDVTGKRAVVTPDGRRLAEGQWAKQLRVTYTPTIVFFDPSGSEVFRIESYLKPFHLASSFDYVASGAYRTQPSFQRFIQARAETMRNRGHRIELW
jgi:thioredoxin-related protein